MKSAWNGAFHPTQSLRSQPKMAFDNPISPKLDARVKGTLTLADITTPIPSDITTASGEISTQVNHFLDDKTSLLAKAKSTLMGAGGINAALPVYDQAIAEAKTIDQAKVKVELDAVTARLKTETDAHTRQILTQEQADLDMLQRLPSIALANKGLAERHHGIAQGQVDIDAAKALDPKMASDRGFVKSAHDVDLDLAGAPADDRTVGRQLNLPRNFNTSMSPFEQAKWLSELPASLSATEKAQQDDLFKKAIAASDSGTSRMLPNANWDVNKALQALRATGVEPNPDSNPALKDVNTRAEALIKTLPADQKSDISLKYYLYSHAVNDQQRQQFRTDLTGVNGGFTKILDDYDAAFHLKPQGNPGGSPYFSWNLGRQRVENETNQAAITRFDYAQVLAHRGDKAGAQQFMKDAIAHNHSTNLNSFLRTMAQAPEIGLSPADLDAIHVDLTIAENNTGVGAVTPERKAVVTTAGVDSAIVRPDTVVAPAPKTEITGGTRQPAGNPPALSDGTEVLVN
jgi:hypothetical protein